MKIRKQVGFTLMEMLIVVAIIAILAAAVFAALNPARRFAEANNSQRWSDITGVLGAVVAYMVDNNGQFPSGLDTDFVNAQVLGTNGNGCEGTCEAVSTGSSCVDLEAVLVAGGYIASIPTDPVTGTSGNSDYYVQRESTGVVTVGACDPEVEGSETPVIRVQR